VRLPVAFTPSTSTWNGVIAGGRGVDGVVHPLAGFDKADVVPSARVGRGFDVDAGAAVGAAVVGGGAIVVSDGFTAVVEILGLDGRRELEGRAVKWSGRQQ
jgi:hypothetical protein